MRIPWRVVVLAAVFASSVSGRARAQDTPAGSSRPRVEARLDAIATQGTGTLQAGAGAAIPAGTYVRIAALVGAGAGGPGLSHASGRVDLVARFLLDPFAQQQRGFYAIAGVGMLAIDGTGRHAEPRLIVGIGVEGSPASGRVRALEIGLGGGVRAGFAWRDSRPNRR